MNRDLHVVLVGHAETGVNRRGRCAPILMELEAARARQNLLRERFAARGIAFPEKAEVHGPGLGSPEHLFEIPTAGRAGSRVRTGRWTGTAADHGGDAVR